VAKVIEFTDPRTHPTFVREQRQITTILAGILVRNGRPERQAIQEAEAILAPLPPRGHAGGRKPRVRRAG
jgi:hypothetical protein